MMPLDPAWIPPTVLAALLAGGLGLALGLLRLHRRIRRAERGAQAQLERLRGDIGGLCGAARRAGDRLIGLEQEVPQLARRLETLDPAGPAGEQFRHAITLVQQGASAADLIATCGLEPGEAALVELLHQDNRSQHKH